MYYNGQYYQTNSLSEAMTQHDLSHGHRPQTRAQAFTDGLIRWMFFAPFIAMFGFMGLLLVEYAIHVLFG